MFKKRVYANNWVINKDDLEQSQAYVSGTFARLFADAITQQNQIAGLDVRDMDGLNIEISTGQLYVYDPQERLVQMYALLDSEIISTSDFKAVQDEVWLCLCCKGQAVDDDIIPRYVMTDVQTRQMQAETHAASELRKVIFEIKRGDEAPNPERPEPLTGYTPLAYIRMGTAAILEIETVAGTRLPNLLEVATQSAANNAWIATKEPELESYASDISKLAAEVANQQQMPMIVRLVAQVAQLQARLDLPQIYKDSFSEVFLFPEDEDVDDPEYRALVDMGLRPAWDGYVEQELALYSPSDPKVKTHGGTLILPTYTERCILRLSGVVGSFNLSSVQYSTQHLRQKTRTYVKIETSNAFKQCENGVHWGDRSLQQVEQKVFEMDPEDAGYTPGTTNGTTILSQVSNTPGHRIFWQKNYRQHVWTETYWETYTKSHSIGGSLSAQTILAPANGWLTSVGLYFKSVNPADENPVTVVLAETTTGMPDPTKVLELTTVPANLLKIGETKFTFPEPVEIEVGKLYSVIVISKGDHAVNLVEGTNYGQGTYFQSTDGKAFVPNLQRDMQMALYVAQFSTTYCVVDLASLSVPGGIAAVEMLYQRAQPEGTNLVFECQPEGSDAWVTLSPEGADKLTGLPAMLRMRLVMTGTHTLMPGLPVLGSKIRGKRPATSFCRKREVYNLAEPSDNITVIMVLDNFYPDYHSVTVSLVSEGVTHDAVSHTDETLEPGRIRRNLSFAPNPGTGIQSVQTRVDGDTTTAQLVFHVESLDLVAL